MDSKIIKENKHYKVRETGDAIGEDGKYGHKGYAVISKENGFVEGTSMIRANALFMMEQFNSMLTSMEEKVEEEGPALTVVEDPVLPH